MNEAIAREQFAGEVKVYTKVLEDIKKLLQGRRVGVDAAALPWNLGRKLSEFCKLEDVSGMLLSERALKKPAEVKAIAKAARLTREILDGLELREGMKESDVQKQLLLATIEAGAEPAFEAIVATATNARFPHYRAGPARLKDMVLIDYGVKWERYCSDVTRCFFLSSNPRMKKAYDACVRVSEELFDLLPGVSTGKEVAKVAEKLMKKNRLPPLIHSIGHGVGLDVHEYPRLNAPSDDPVSGRVLAIEPAAYFNDFGVRYENTVYFDGKKVKVL